MKLAIAQINCVLGDLAANSAKILQYAEQAKMFGAQLMLTPELSLCGYPPEDLLLRSGFYQACTVALNELAQKISGIAVLVGHPYEHHGQRYNAASLLRDGKVVTTYCKHELPNDAVFDEMRYFNRGSEPCMFELSGIKFGLNICEDVWKPEAAQRASTAGAQVLLVMNASPFAIAKQERRYSTVRERITETGMAVVYANMVGGQDELIFDGGSFAMDKQGKLTLQCTQLVEALACLEISADGQPGGGVVPLLSTEASVYQALCLGVRLHHQESFPRCVAGVVGRHRFRTHLGRCGRCARRRQGACGDDAFSLYGADQSG
jgi:NAD+ synthase (glutamine-hydrolysing)